MILQAYDFLELHRRYGCLLQMGGSDQWGNIVNWRGPDAPGHRRGSVRADVSASDHKRRQEDGEKPVGQVWLNADLFSPYEFWQFWRNTTDADVGRFLKLYTELPVEECDRLGKLGGSEINQAKIALANAVTTLLHGAEAAAAAEATARDVFEKGGIGDELPTVVLEAEELAEGVGIVQLFVRAGPCGQRQGCEAADCRRRGEGEHEIITDTALRYGASHLVEPDEADRGQEAARFGGAGLSVGWAIAPTLRLVIPER